MPKPPTTDRVTERVERVIREKYTPAHPNATVKAYRYSGWSIRVRVVDPDFEGKTFVERETELFPILRAFPDRDQERITMLLTLTPEESARSPLSAEFDKVGTPAAR
jgi:stress-induced morphogen